MANILDSPIIREDLVLIKVIRSQEIVAAVSYG